MLSRDTAPSGVPTPFLGPFLHFLGVGNGSSGRVAAQPRPHALVCFALGQCWNDLGYFGAHLSNSSHFDDKSIKLWVNICPIWSIFWVISHFGSIFAQFGPFSPISHSLQILKQTEQTLGQYWNDLGHFWAHLSNSSHFDDKSIKLWVNICPIWSIFWVISHFGSIFAQFGPFSPISQSLHISMINIY